MKQALLADWTQLSPEERAETIYDLLEAAILADHSRLIEICGEVDLRHARTIARHSLDLAIFGGAA